MMSAGTLVVVVDLGKTQCRAGLRRDGRSIVSVDGPGAPGLAEDGGARAAAQAIASLIPQLGELITRAPDVVSVGVAGARAAPTAAAELAGLLHRELGARRTVVTSDAVTAHAGALGGASGVSLSAGTGAVALGISRCGRSGLVDGWGPWLGDEGGGGWVGRTGLGAVLRAGDGRGPPTALTAYAERRYGDLNRLPATLAATGAIAAVTAGFGPDVALCATSGDAVAQSVIDAAAASLAETTVAAVRAVHDEHDDHDGDHDAVPVVLSGGLSHWGPVLIGHWRAALDEAAQRFGIVVDVREPLGTSLDGAALLAETTTLPHELQVLRFPPGSEEDA